MHLNGLTISSEEFPTREHYPFNLEILNSTKSIVFNTPITFFIGENGTGKPTLLKAMAKKCSVPIWEETERSQFYFNKYSEELFRYIQVHWTKEVVPGSFFLPIGLSILHRRWINGQFQIPICLSTLVVIH